MFDAANEKWFSGQLERADVAIGSKKETAKAFGMKYAKGYYIMGVTTDHGEYQDIILCKDLGKKHLYATLLHEMVHVFQAQTSGRMDHGKSFKKWRKHFLTKGIKI